MPPKPVTSRNKELSSAVRTRRQRALSQKPVPPSTSPQGTSDIANVERCVTESEPSPSTAADPRTPVPPQESEPESTPVQDPASGTPVPPEPASTPVHETSRQKVNVTDASLKGVLAPSGTTMDVSITVGRKGTHVYDVWFQRLHEILEAISVKSALALETGPRAGHAHLQGVARFKVTVPFVGACKAIVAAFKEYLPVAKGDKGVVQVKPLAGVQSFLGMIGYVTKLPLGVRLWNVSAAEVKEGQSLYALVKVDPLSGKRALNKSNFMKEVFAFWHRHLRPLRYPIETVVLYMVQSGDYMPTSVWLLGECVFGALSGVGPSGSGMDATKAKIFWSFCHESDKATPVDIKNLFFSRSPGGGNR